MQPTPHRALTIPEIGDVVRDYGRAAEPAMDAGFEGVELHAANGYLIDQFLENGSNKRTDEYGGSIENRSRFLHEVVTELVSVCGADRPPTWPAFEHSLGLHSFCWSFAFVETCCQGYFEGLLTGSSSKNTPPASVAS